MGELQTKGGAFAGCASITSIAVNPAALHSVREGEESIHGELRLANVVTQNHLPSSSPHSHFPVRSRGLDASGWSIGSLELVGPRRRARRGRLSRGDRRPWWLAASG
jgi:hypothetical protein